MLFVVKSKHKGNTKVRFGDIIAVAFKAVQDKISVPDREAAAYREEQKQLAIKRMTLNAGLMTHNKMYRKLGGL